MAWGRWPRETRSAGHGISGGGTRRPTTTTTSPRAVLRRVRAVTDAAGCYVARDPGRAVRTWVDAPALFRPGPRPLPPRRLLSRPSAAPPPPAPQSPAPALGGSPATRPISPPPRPSEGPPSPTLALGRPARPLRHSAPAPESPALAPLPPRPGDRDSGRRHRRRPLAPWTATSLHPREALEGKAPTLQKRSSTVALFAARRF